MESKYSFDIHVSNYYTDPHFNMRPAAFLDIAQDSATRGATALKFDDEALKPFGCAWVVARMRTKFLRPVKFKEDMKIYTWHRGLHGVNYFRDYQLVDAEGKPAISSTSIWLIMDKEARTITRDPEVYSFVNRDSQSSDCALDVPANKIVMPKDSEISLLGTHRVTWSDVDINYHANNVKYTVWAMDALPEDLVYNHRLLEHSINFNKEVRPGDMVELLHAEKDGAHIIEGRVGEHQAFICSLIFDPETL